VKIAILAAGSRGDVQPHVALGVRLQQRGHQVRVGAFGTFRTLVTAAGLDFASIGELPASAERTGAQTRGVSSARYGGLAGMVRFQLQFPWLLVQYADQVAAACEGAELIVYNRGAAFAPDVAERQGIRCLAAYALPETPTRTFVLPWYARATQESAAWIAASYRLDSVVRRHLRHRARNWFRRRIGLAPLGRRAARRWPDPSVPALLYGFSETVLPRPTEWPPHVHVTGFWHDSTATGWTPPARLAQFLESGPPPLTIGFGSMLPHDSAATLAVLTDALERTGTRAVILSGFANLGGRASDGDRVLIVDHAPHDWLFPRAAAALHHGGAGTCAAALRAGIPSIVVPFAFDQLFWGRRLAELGVAPSPIAIGEMRPASIARAIETATNGCGMRERAQRISTQLAQEDGAGRAAALIERYAHA
jgi:UDP:flavonoid glycosyltransferase YjiC (YdhE family)